MTQLFYYISAAVTKREEESTPRTRLALDMPAQLLGLILQVRPAVGLHRGEGALQLPGSTTDKASVLTEEVSESSTCLREDLRQCIRVFTPLLQQQQPTEKKQFYYSEQLQENKAFMDCRTPSWTFQVLSFSFSHIRLHTSTWKRAAHRHYDQHII
ncbi:hypothetical protein F7725_005540 [Dissostichus mawsoni]|uniref:Uncharacterized protein n=1 Tax=Dissostichus mawsoni TaxID=36200 RepID=A0A7J5YRU8_DISMA|nr:hypothetical protein F7725_005540 [Dissostichus mawsoni]